MNPRQVIAACRKLADERGWSEGSPHETYLLGLLTAREDARHALLQRIQALQRELDRIAGTLEASSPLLNTLGELQQKPAAVEAGVGEFAACDKALRDYLATFPPVRGD